MKSKGFFPAIFFVALLYSMLPCRAGDNARAQHASRYTNRSELLFTPNKGQLVDTKGEKRPDMLFFSQSAGAEVYFSRQGVHYVFRHTEELPTALAAQRQHGVEGMALEQRGLVVKQHRIDMEIVGGNPNVVVESADEKAEYINYYLAHCPHGVDSVVTYGKLIYRDIYPRIDLVFYSVGNQLKYDFLVHPGGDVAAIALRYSAADKVELTEEGAVQAWTSLGNVKDERPWSYQEYTQGGIRQARVASRYDLHNNTIRFVVGAYDKERTLVIDPGILWSTYYGGMDSDIISDAAVDKEDNVIVTGYTKSPVFAATAGAFQDTLYANSSLFNDAFIAKFTKDGQRVWATYLGGSKDDKSFTVAVDSLNHIIIAGQTYSPDLPDTLAAIDSLFTSSPDGFIFKFTRNGRRVWGTYFGGQYLEVVTSVAVDKNGHVFFTGTTTSDRYTFPLLNPSQQVFGGLSDAFVGSLSIGGGLLWATFYGGDDSDFGNDISIDTSGNVYVVGKTSSTNLSQTAGRFQSSKRGLNDAFVLKTRANGQFLWATYYGGSETESGNGISTDNNGNIVFAGETSSTDFPLRTALQSTIAGDRDAFVAKMDSAGRQVWSTYYGGDSTENVYGLAVDSRGGVAVVGTTMSADFPLTANAFQRALIPAGDPREPTIDAFFFQLNSQGDTLLSTYLGSNGYDEARCAAFDSMDNLVVGGGSYGGNLPIKNAYQPTKSAFQDGFLLRYGCDVRVTVTPATSPSFCTGGSVTLDAGAGFARYEWNTGSTAQSITVSTSGTFSVTVTDNLRCRQTASIVVTVHPLPTPVLFSTTSTTFCQGDSVVLMLNKAYSAYQWGDNSTKASLVVNKSGTYTVTVTDANGCKAVVSTTVTVHAIPVAAVRSTVDFGIVPACRSSIVDTITIVNSGTSAFDITSVVLDGAEFSVLPVVTTPISLLPARKQTFTLRFQPSGLGIVQGTMTIRLLPCGKEYVVALRGEKQGEVSILSDVTTVDFGAHYICATAKRDTTVTVYNKGTSSIIIGASSIDAPFEVDAAGFPATVASGDSIKVALRHTPPGVEGSSTAELSIPYQAGDCSDTLRLVVKSLTLDAVLTTATLSVDFGSLNGCDDATTATIRLRNRGTASLTVKSLTGDANFRLLGAPQEITADAERDVVVEFRPASEGVFGGTAKLLYSVGPCDKEIALAVQGRKEGVSFTVGESVDFGSFVACEQESSTATLSISVGGQIEGEVQSVQVDGPFTTSLQAGTKITGGAQQQFTVQFVPTADGNHTGTITLVLEPCGITKTIALRGQRTNAALVLRQEQVDYGLHTVGTTDKKSIVVRNTGTAPVWVEKIEGLAAPFAFVPPAPTLPVRIAPGDSLVVEVEYTATEGEQQKDVRFESTKPCTLVAIATLRGRGKNETQQAGTAHIAIPTMLRADVHEKNFRIPIVLAGSSTLQQAGATSLRMNVHYDGTLFALHSVYKGRLLGDTTYADGMKKVTIAIDTIVSYQAGFILAELVGDVLLGQNDRTALEIDSVVWTTGRVTETQVSSGLLTVEGICEAGGQRLLSYRGSFGIESIVPNPIEKSPARITVHTVEEGATSLEVYSKEGRRVYAEQWEGRSEQRTIIIPETLSNGTYIVVLRSPTKNDTGIVVIMR